MVAATDGMALQAAPVVVVGSGPVGVRFTERLAALDSTRRVLLLGDEPFRPYDRVRLSAVVAREMRPDALFCEPGLTRLSQVRVLADRRIVRIDRANRFVVDARGETFAYSSLVLATGSRPRLPAIPGLELDQVYAFRSMRDAEKLLARQIGSRATVVIGGGLLGLEVARAMRRFGTRVHVVEHEAHLMLHQLDEEAAGLLRRHVEGFDIRVHLGESVQQIVGMYRPELVRLRSGSEIDCDTVVLATGIVPNVELARDARLAVGRGITVDDRMQTSDPAIHAIGECAEHRGRIYGLVGPGLEQAGVAANHVAGRPSDFRGSIVASSLKVAGCAVFSMGDAVESVHDFTPHVFRSGSAYRRVNVHRGKVIGAVAFGDWDTARLRNAGLERERVWPWQLWRFRRRGELWTAAGSGSVAGWPPAATVCSCRGVTREALDYAIGAGASTVEALSAATGAATVCGSCKPLLGALLGNSARLPIPRVLATASVIGIVLALVAWFVSLPYATEMRPGWRWDQLWTDGSAKQVSGFSLLGLGLLVSLISLRKRIRRFRFARYAGWQAAHVVGGVAVIAALLAHTGFRFGENLNAWLMLSFTTLVVAGGLAGTATAFLQRSGQAATRRLQAVSLWTHIFLLWPLPTLIGFHVLKSYWF